MLRKRGKLIAVLLFIVTLSALTFFYFRSHRVVVQVGDYAITAQDVWYRNQIQKITYPSDPGDYGQIQLVKAYQAAQILKNNGMEITERTLREEERRIDQNTKDPKTLEQIKAVFGQDHESYKKVFILPIFAERTIYYDFFMRNPKLQSQSLIKAHEFSESLKVKGGDLHARAQESGLIVRKFTVSHDHGVVWAPVVAPSAHAESDAAALEISQDFQKQSKLKVGSFEKKVAREWIQNVISQLKPGQIFHEPIDQGENWAVVKYLKSSEKHQYFLEAVLFPKLQYDEWLEAEKARVQVTTATW